MNFGDIYPKLNTLSCFRHPKTELCYDWLTPKSIIQLAEQSIMLIAKTGIFQVFVSECGAVPFAKLCAKIAEKKQMNLTWYCIKVPREIDKSFESTFQYYCNRKAADFLLPLDFHANPKNESFSVSASAEPHFVIARNEVTKQSSSPENPGLLRHFVPRNDEGLANIMNELQKPNDLEKNKEEQASLLSLQSKTKSSDLFQILQKPFIYFDEYIDSGKTLFQTIRFLQLFNPGVQFKLFCYLIKLPQAQLNPDFISSLYTLDSEEEAYQFGVYPFENRLDLIGYYYFNDNHHFKRSCISSLSSPLQGTPLTIKKFPLAELFGIINLALPLELKSSVQKQCAIPEVAQFIQEHHLVQYALYRLEILYYASTDISELLFQLFDMYGPVWSPMPDEYHLDYLNAFEKMTPIFDKYLNLENILSSYVAHRETLINHVAAFCENTRQQFYTQLENVLEEKTYECEY